MIRPTAWLLVLLLVLSAVANANGGQGPATGPPGAATPDAFSRDSDGRVTVRAVRATVPIRIDGRLDEAVYGEVTPIADFLQTEPELGKPATEKTDVWVLFDDDNIYVSVRCWETQPERMIVNVMQRDSANLMQNENFGFMFDPFHDRRNALMFMVNPIGGRTDGQVVDRQYNRDWNAVWEVKTARFDKGWTAEFAIPFKSLRYGPGRDQVWGFNARRIDRWKSETSHLTQIPKSMVSSGLFQPSLAATIVGIEAPSGSKNLEIKPYGISNVSTDRKATPATSNDVTADVGLDVKYGVTPNLTADFTYNTDFAQVEADEQQVNLTRFSLFFPEKREFFLENLGLFNFGGATSTSATGSAPVLFYSRRIGLNQALGRVVPIQGGGRLTGRAGRYRIGVLDIRTDQDAASRSTATNFAVMRVKRDVLRKSSIGVLMTGRSVVQTGTGSNQTYGVDGTFAFFDDLAVNTYWAKTDTTGRSGSDISYRGQIDYNADRYGVQVERLVIGSNFNPEVGFVRRADMRLTSGLLRFSPRPRTNRYVRKLSWSGSVNYIENGAGRLETRDSTAEFSIDFMNTDRIIVGRDANYDAPRRPFTVGPNVLIPVASYDFGTTRVAFQFGQHRRIFGLVRYDVGTYYGGDRHALTVSTARATVTPQISLEPTWSVNRIELPQRSFTTNLLGSRITYTVTPDMFASALVQYNSDLRSVSTNVRLRWEYRPGSELFIVYNEQRDTTAPRLPLLTNRAFIIKFNRLFRS